MKNNDDVVRLYGTEEGSAATGTNNADQMSQQVQKYADEKNYKALLNSQIAAYNMKANTQKYLGNYLASNGVNTQGYGSTARIGAENQYQNLYAQNVSDFNASEENSGTENDNQLATWITNSDGSDEQISQYMKNYGYTLGEDGTWKNATGAAPTSYILSAIQNAKNGSTNNYTGAGFTDASSAADGILMANGEVANRADGFGLQEELKYLFQEWSNPGHDGTVVKLSNGNAGGTNYAYVIFKNGRWYQTTEDAWNSAQYKGALQDPWKNGSNKTIYKNW